MLKVSKGENMDAFGRNRFSAPYILHLIRKAEKENGCVVGEVKRKSSRKTIMYKRQSKWLYATEHVVINKTFFLDVRRTDVGHKSTERHEIFQDRDVYFFLIRKNGKIVQVLL